MPFPHIHGTKVPNNKSLTQLVPKRHTTCEAVTSMEEITAKFL
jgi:hypothetical protein